MNKIKSNIETLLGVINYFPNDPTFLFNIEITTNSTIIKVTIPEGKSINTSEVLNNILRDNKVKSANINLVGNVMIVSIIQ